MRIISWLILVRKINVSSRHVPTPFYFSFTRRPFEGSYTGQYPKGGTFCCLPQAFRRISQGLMIISFSMALVLIVGLPF